MKRPPRSFFQPKSKNARKATNDHASEVNAITETQLDQGKNTVTNDEHKCAAVSGLEIEETLIDLCSKFITEEMADVTGEASPL